MKIVMVSEDDSITLREVMSKWTQVKIPSSMSSKVTAELSAYNSDHRVMRGWLSLSWWFEYEEDALFFTLKHL